MHAPPISRPALAFFRRIVRRYFRRHFDGVRVSQAQRFSQATGPLIVFANHSSWWDPMVLVLLAAKLMPQRRHFAPMDAVALERYGILKHIGIFPVEMNSARGAAQFLRGGESILESGGVLWLTPQGQFVDARQRPLVFKSGLAALAARSAPCTLLPLALEYTFWNERTPECLMRFGEPVLVSEGTEEYLQERLIQALERTMNELSVMAIRRDPREFETLLRGKNGPGGLYELGQRIAALAHGRRYQPEHSVLLHNDISASNGHGRDDA
jgi:1-acyl-sn-glycerol-3-phosphate acyltransferase